MAPLCSARGLVADVRPIRAAVKYRRTDPSVIAASLLGAAVFMSMGLLSFIGRVDTAETDSSVKSSESFAYDFRVYALNQTYLERTSYGTEIRFNSADLPFAFSTITFGDYRADSNLSGIYYGGSGILMSAGGGAGQITLKEANGKLVTDIDYHGQSQVVFNGKRESVTYPSALTTYNGTDQMVQDWRNGLWTPEEGVIVEHPSNVTLDSASFFIMTLEPNDVMEIPEFDLLLPVAVSPLIALYALRRNSAVKE